MRYSKLENAILQTADLLFFDGNFTFLFRYAGFICPRLRGIGGIFTGLPA